MFNLKKKFHFIKMPSALKVAKCSDPLFPIYVDHYVHDGGLESLALSGC